MEKGKCIFYSFAFFFLVTGTGVAASFDVDQRKCRSGPPTKLFVFGDSYADTGNLGRSLGRFLARSWFEPYGMTFPKKPTGRFSDGRVLTDFVASLLGIKSPIPYKIRRYGPTLLPYGMNFAVGGSGVFDTGNFQSNLTAQIDKFQGQIDGGVFSNKDIKSSAALVVISGNDYARFSKINPNNSQHILLFMRRLFVQLKVDLVRLDRIGVPRVIITNLHPVQCTPSYTRATNYTRCPSNIYSAVEEHNHRVGRMVKYLNRAGNADFLSLDVNAAFLKALLQAKVGGEDKIKYPLMPCCESSSETTNCGQLDAKGNKLYSVCERPEEHFYWDNLHPSQAGWAAAFEFLKASLSRFLRI